MGCDIHGWVEKKVGNKWVAVKELTDTSRNYYRFNLLASVRGYSGVKPRGIPEDVSDTCKYWIDAWGTDGHSHSYLPLEKAAEIFSKTGKTNIPIEECEWLLAEYFDLFDDSYDDYRLVFWFDN